MLIAVLIAFSIFLIGYMIRGYFKSKRERDNYDIPEDELTDDLNVEQAKVAAKREANEWSGTKLPEYHLGLYMTFIKEDGTLIEYHVSKEIYLKYNISDTATLVTVNGRFLDFGDGEDIQ